MSIAAMEKALEALKAVRHGHCDHAWADEAITALNAAIDAAEKQEPVAWQGVYDKTDLYYRKPVQGDVRPLYTTPRAAPVQEPAEKVDANDDDYWDDVSAMALADERELTPVQEPVACLSKSQAKAILDLALELETTGRLVVITEGQERSDFVARNRNIQCALEDALRNATTPPAARRQPLTDEQIIGSWEKLTGKKLPNMGPSISQLIAYTRVVEAAHGIKENT
jgi:hypothetical protein